MKVKVNIKKIGKQRPGVAPEVYEIAGNPSTVRELIISMTTACVQDYNSRFQAKDLYACLTRYESNEELAVQAQTGKIDFGVNYGEKEADEIQAARNAVQCFEDGIYRIFLDEKPLSELDERISLTEESVLTFVRLTMLAGRMW